MASTTIQCPSCEAGFAVKDNLIGKKVDCPKCKYRFKAELADDDDDAPKVKKSDKAKKGGNNTLVIGGVIGALALILLAVGAFFIFGGSGDSGGSANKGGGSNTSPRTSTSEGGGPTGGSSDGGAPTGDGKGEGSGDKTDGGGTPAAGGTSPDKPKAVKPGDLKHASNLLPGEAVSVYCVYAERLLQTPLFNSVFDRNTQEFFRNSMTFDASDIETYHHCVVNPDRTPFGVFRLKKPLDELAILNRTDNVKGPLSPIKGRSYNTIKSNPFLDAIGRALSSESIRNEAGIPVTEEDKKKWGENKPLAFHVYDSQTLIVASQLDLERFLQDLDDKGDPPMKSILAPDAPPPESTPMPGGAPGGDAAPDGGAGSIGLITPRSGVERTLQGRGRPGQGGPGGPGGPPPGGQGDRGGDDGRGGPGSADGGAPGGQPGTGTGNRPRRSFTSNPHYRTVDEQLKFMLNRLEDEDTNNPPAVIYAEILDQRYFNNRQFGALFRETGDALFGLLSQLKVVGAAIRVFNKDKFVASAAFEFMNEADARQATSRFIQPILEQVTPVLSLFLGTQIEIRNNSQGGANPNPGAFGPGGIPGEPGPGGGAPLPSGVGAGGGIAPGGGGGTADGGPGGGGDPRGGFGPGAGIGGTSSPSFISVTLSDKATIFGMEILWNEERYKRTILPAIVNLASQLKGRMAVLSGETTWHNLAAAFPKMKAAGNKPFPRGTLEREIVSERFGLPFPPEQRVSFLADLLPFLGKGGLRSSIQEKKFPWYAKENLPAAESWVPEFLVPYYPQTAWRASHPMAEGKVLGATNFVGLAGLGLDAARYNPNANPEHAKKAGITGYDWGSTPAEITDGMSNTIYMIQAPPGIRRAWMAGGGATLVGVDDTLPNPISDFVHTTPDKKRGTYVLMADGSVRWVTESIDAKVFKGMVTRAGGETLGDLDKLTPKVDPPKGKTVELKGAGSAAAPKGGEAPAPADVLDAEELKKFQGDWKVTMLFVKGVRLPTEQIDAAKIVLTFEGEMMRAESPLIKDGLPNGRILGLDTKSSPHTMRDETTSGPEKGKKDTSVYEFVGPNKLKLRSAESGKPAPKQVSVPETGSKDTYIELERILKD